MKIPRPNVAKLIWNLHKILSLNFPELTNYYIKFTAFFLFIQASTHGHNNKQFNLREIFGKQTLKANRVMSTIWFTVNSRGLERIWILWFLKAELMVNEKSLCFICNAYWKQHHFSNNNKERFQWRWHRSTAALAIAPLKRRRRNSDFARFVLKWELKQSS